MDEPITQAYINKAAEVAFLNEKIDAMVEVGGFAAKALEFAVSEAEAKTQPTEAATRKAKALNHCTVLIGAVGYENGYEGKIECIVSVAKAISALDPEGLSGGEMREEILEIYVADPAWSKWVEEKNAQRLAA